MNLYYGTLRPESDGSGYWNTLAKKQNILKAQRVLKLVAPGGVVNASPVA